MANTIHEIRGSRLAVRTTPRLRHGAQNKQPRSTRNKRGPMNLRLKSAFAVILAVSLVSTSGYASDATPPAKKRAAKPKGPSVEDQIQALRQEMQGQIDSLKKDLSDKDAQLKQAQQAAADAQAAG